MISSADRDGSPDRAHTARGLTAGKSWTLPKYDRGLTLFGQVGEQAHRDGTSVDLRARPYRRPSVGVTIAPRPGVSDIRNVRARWRVDAAAPVECSRAEDVRRKQHRSYRGSRLPRSSGINASEKARQGEVRMKLVAVGVISGNCRATKCPVGWHTGSLLTRVVKTLDAPSARNAAKSAVKHAIPLTVSVRHGRDPSRRCRDVEQLPIRAGPGIADVRQ